MGKVTKSMITDFDEFKKSWEKDAGKPENTILYYLIAALNLEKDKDTAEDMMTVVLTKNDLREDGSSPTGFKLGNRASYFVGQFLESKNNARSYVGGTNENNYEIDWNNLALTVVRKLDHQGGLKFFIHSGGRDNPVPCQLKKNKHGQWKLTEYSSFCMDVKPPQSEVDDF
ncbi:MAG: hypothetical protein GF411_10425 [Candidatus Lokiarchaeota archaeon]|nr:hypothetical protein [Candidatus Lokiarchaeota archaeon]